MWRQVSRLAGSTLGWNWSTTQSLGIGKLKSLPPRLPRPIRRTRDDRPQEGLHLPRFRHRILEMAAADLRRLHQLARQPVDELWIGHGVGLHQRSPATVGDGSGELPALPMERVT